MASNRNFISGAIRHPGAFSRAAKRAGYSTAAYAQKEKGKGGVTGRRARLAITLGKLRRRRGG